MGVSIKMPPRRGDGKGPVGPADRLYGAVQVGSVDRDAMALQHKLTGKHPEFNYMAFGVTPYHGGTP